MSHLEPPSFTRVYGSEFDEELDENKEEDIIKRKAIFTWSPYIINNNNNNILECNTLIIANHREACTFLKLYLNLLNIKDICGIIMIPQKNSIPTTLNAPSLLNDNSASSYIYQHENDIYVIAQQNIDEANTFEWCTTLFSHIKPNNVIMLSSLFQSLYIPFALEEMKSPPMLRYLHTSHINTIVEEETDYNPEQCLYLMPPNMIDGLAAAIISHCEVFNIKAKCYISIVSPNYLVESVEAFKILNLWDKNIKEKIFTSSKAIIKLLEGQQAQHFREKKPSPMLFM